MIPMSTKVAAMMNAQMELQLKDLLAWDVILKATVSLVKMIKKMFA